MFLSNPSNAPTAAQIWAAAGGRTITADPATDAVAGLIVWSTHQPRTLTLASNILTCSNNVNGSLAAASTQVFNRSAGQASIIHLAIATATNMAIEHWDFTTAIKLNTLGETGMGGLVIGQLGTVRLNNTSAGAIVWNGGFHDWHF